jgi:hypothetical protein
LRRFIICRTGDNTYAHRLAEGVAFTNGWASIAWLLDMPNVAAYPSMDEVVKRYNVVFEGEWDVTEAELEDEALKLRLQMARSAAAKVVQDPPPAIVIDDGFHVELAAELAFDIEQDPVIIELQRQLGVATTALERIRSECGVVCSEFETCAHTACQSSYTAWDIANEALGPASREVDRERPS